MLAHLPGTVRYVVPQRYAVLTQSGKWGPTVAEYTGPAYPNPSTSRLTPDPIRTLHAISELALHLAQEWDGYRRVEAELGQSSIPSQGGDRRGSDVPDPVHRIALSHERYHTAGTKLGTALNALRDVSDVVNRARSQRSDVAGAVREAVAAARCTGVVGSDPTCTRNAVRNMYIGGVPHPTCWACIKRAQRQEAQADTPLEPYAPTRDCGHVCCTQRHNPNHTHWKQPHQCAECDVHHMSTGTE